MSVFRATNLATSEVVEYVADAPQPDHLTSDWRLEEVFETAPVDDAGEPLPTTVYGGRRWLTKLEFVSLLGLPAYVATLEMARESAAIEAFVKSIDWATPDANGYSLCLDDPRMQQLYELETALIAQGVVTPGWAAGVLNG